MHNNSSSNSHNSTQYDCYSFNKEENDHYLYSQEQYQKGTRIPPPNNTTYSIQNEMGNRYESVYDDILSFTSGTIPELFSYCA